MPLSEEDQKLATKLYGHKENMQDKIMDMENIQIIELAINSLPCSNLSCKHGGILGQIEQGF